MKIKTFLFLFFVSINILLAGDLLLKPLNPYPLQEDMFSVTVDDNLDRPIQTKPWVKLQAEWLHTKSLGEGYVTDSVDKSHKVDLRLFLIKDGASYDEIREAIRKLLSMGFRNTTIRHLIAFSNTENAKKLNAGVLVVASLRPELKLDDINTISLRGFYGAIIKSDGISVVVVMPEQVNLLPTRVLILEPPYVKF